MPKTKKIFTVSQINSLIKVALEEKLPPRMIVRGEISDFKHHTSGHCYFSLKEEGAVLPCVMWASKFKKVKFSPEDGMEVLSTGHIDVYTPGGKYQLYVDKLEPAGVGALQLAFEQMVAKLLKEGLFDESHKKALPLYPMRIGILTSESSAALHDITDSIHSRWPCAKLFLYPVPVQGKGSAAKIASALRDINKRNQKLKLDVLIVGRGGGAMEDLWAFNEEVLARAIFDSTIPTISAVGHEVDTTIADLVADARASTPTKAGVVAVPDIKEILAQLTSTEQRLSNQTHAILKIAKHQLQVILADALFRNPFVLVQNNLQQLDELSAELTEVVRELLTEAHRKLSTAYEQIIRIEPHRLLGHKTIELNNWQNRAEVGIRAIVNDCRMQLTARDNRLSALNPKSVLHRGYSITTNKQTGSLIKTSEDVRIGDYLITELANENLIESEVKKK
jgi:exodeoxyribonuclease VII large subunit